MDSRQKKYRKNPAETSNFLSYLFFSWTAPIFWKGAKRDLLVTDLYSPLESDESEHLGDRLEREWEKELRNADQESIVGKDGSKKSKKEPSLGWAIFRIFWIPIMIQGLLELIRASVLQLIILLLQGLIISYFNSDQNLITREQVFLYTGILVLLTFSAILLSHHAVYRAKRIGMCVRVACCSMLYRKILRLNQTVVNNTAAGQVANLMSNDVGRFDDVTLCLNFIWITPIQVPLIGYLMWRSIGYSTLVGVGSLLVMTVPVQIYMSYLCGKLRSKIAAKTDERVQLMSELISGIQVVKMYSWEKPFELIVSKVRALELKFIRYTSYLKGSTLSMMMYAQRVGIFLTLICFVLMGNQLTADTAYVIVGLFQVLQETCIIYLPLAIILSGEATVSLKRVKEFLLLDEISGSRNAETRDENTHAKTEISKVADSRIGVEIVKVTANWVHDQITPTLNGVSMEIRYQSLCVIVGPVGSGKSTLLHLLLGELPITSGSMSLFIDDTRRTRISKQDIRISYASQDPWLFPASVRDNILFGQPMDERRYKEVTRVCALHKDFEQLPQGDLSFVGEHGASLSGGQKARVNLARAVYRDAELYLLDDPLSAVDAEVGRHLFDECITGFLKDKTRIIVTHQLQYLPRADTIVVLKQGTVEYQNTYEELVRANVHILDSEQSEKSNEVEYHGDIYQEKLDRKATFVTATDNDSRSLESISKEIGSEDVSEEEPATGNISGKVYRDYLLAGGNFCSLAILAACFIIGQTASNGTDYWLSYWTNQETLRAASPLNISSDSRVEFHNNTEGNRNSTYSKWSHQDRLLTQDQGIHIYTAFICACVFFVTLSGMLVSRMTVKASRNIHNSMFANLICATMRFFNTNPSGRILNRFSKDVGAMDELLPKVIFEAVQIPLTMVGIFVLVIVANNWMFLPAVILTGTFILVTKCYLKTARDVKRLEGITKSPMFSHANSTLNGLITIRSRGALAAGLLRREFDSHQNGHTSAWYLNIVTSTAFGLLLDTLSCTFLVCVCFTFIIVDAENTLGGFVGLAISQSMHLAGEVQYGIRETVELISHMISVERVLEYTNLPKDGPFVTEKPPPPTWPSEGGLVMKNVTMRYAVDKPPVLKGINLTMNPGWKVGIVGRTGAGKSSLISALFRLTGDGLEGEITLDGIDTKSIGLHELRRRISIIPQEPVLFSASLRYNLDPFEEYSDAQLWDSLREVELGDVVPALDFQVAGGGANFSVGQRQLICLARAILRNNRLLILDEATANVDRRTDALIQKTIRRKFTDCTVLTIAHRLNTIMDNDRVMVMAEGCAVEFGHPHLLLKNRNGQFSQMVQQTGQAIAAELAEIAENTFLLRSESDEKSNDVTVIEAENLMITRL